MLNKLHRFAHAERKHSIAWLFVRGWASSLGRHGMREYDPRWLWYRRRLETVMTSPFPLSAYERLLDVLRARRSACVMPLTATYDREGEAIVLRHDVDLRGCARNLEAMIRVEKERGFRSSIFIRVDGVEYDPAMLRETVARLAGDGFDIGLHSVAYMAARPEDEFAHEVGKFESSLGLAPQVFNFHGLGATGLASRMELVAQARNLMGRFPSLAATDCHSSYYVYGMMDCHGSGTTRRLLSDFVSPPIDLARGCKMVILTHPTYWDVGRP